MNAELITAKQTEWQTRYWLTNIVRGRIIAEIDSTPEAWGDHKGLHSYCSELFSVSASQTQRELKAYKLVQRLINDASSAERTMLMTTDESMLREIPSNIHHTLALEALTKSKTAKEVKAFIANATKPINKEEEAKKQNNLAEITRQYKIDKIKAKVEAKELAIERAEADRLAVYQELKKEQETKSKVITADDIEDELIMDEPDYFTSIGVDTELEYEQRDIAEASYKYINELMDTLAKEIASIRELDEGISNFSIYKYDIAIENV